MTNLKNIFSVGTYTVVFFSMSITFGIELWASQLWQGGFSLWLAFFLLICWSFLPYLLLINQVKFLQKSGAHWFNFCLLFVASAIITIHAVVTLCNFVMVFSENLAQDAGIILLLLPGGQLLVVFVVIAVAMGLDAIINRYRAYRT